MDMEYDVIIPVAVKDAEIAIKNIPYVSKYLSPRKIIIMSGKEAENQIKNVDFCGCEVQYIDENEVLSGLTYGHVYEYLSHHGEEARTGWYFQQFLKMGYAFLSETDYYLAWDADTVPLRKIELFDKNGVPFFSTKKEYNKPYFDFIERVFGLEKCIPDSFIAEHMLFSTELMREIVETIQRRTGKVWYDGILGSIDKDVLGKAGFSEFETYGTYVMSVHKKMYRIRQISALRAGKDFFGVMPKEPVREWLSRQYETISFEKGGKQIVFGKAYNNRIFRRIFSAKQYILACRIIARLKAICYK